MNNQSQSKEDLILEKLTNLEERVDRISKIIGLRNEKKTPAEKVPEVKSVDLNEVYGKKEIKITPKKEINLLPILAVICFGLAGIFMVNLAIDSGWLTEDKQWGLLSVFGISLVSVGLFFKKIDNNYRSYASAAGVIILYLAAYSSSLYFHLFDPIFSQVLGGVVSLLCFYLYRTHLTEYFVVICTIGTYISPVLLHDQTDLISLSGFFIIWSALFSRISIYIRSRSLVLLGAYFSIGIFAFLNMNLNQSDELLIVIMVQIVQFVLYAGSVYYYTIKTGEYLSRSEALSYLPILLFFYGVIYYFFNKFDAFLAPYISLCMAGIVYLLYYRAKREIKNLESRELIHSYLAVVIFHTGYVQLLPMESKSWLLPLFILGKYISENKKDFPQISGPLKFAFSAMAIIEFFSLCFKLIMEGNLFNVIPAFFTIVLGYFYYAKKSETFKDIEALFLGLIHVLCIISLYRIVYDYGSLAVSLVWALYSIIVLTVGYKNKNRSIAKSSLVILTVTCLKALVYDAAQSPSTVRIASLILTGAVLYGAGYLFQKINQWDAQ